MSCALSLRLALEVRATGMHAKVTLMLRRKKVPPSGTDPPPLSGTSKNPDDIITLHAPATPAAWSRWWCAAARTSTSAACCLGSGSAGLRPCNLVLEGFLVVLDTLRQPSATLALACLLVRFELRSALADDLLQLFPVPGARSLPRRRRSRTRGQTFRPRPRHCRWTRPASRGSLHPLRTGVGRRARRYGAWKDKVIYPQQPEASII